MRDNEIYYENPKIGIAQISWRLLKKYKEYQIVGEYTLSTGEILYIVVDESGYDNYYTMDKFIIKENKNE